MAASTPEDREWPYHGALQAKLDEPVLASMLVRAAGGGLPDPFLLAVTPTRVHAFAAAFAAGEFEAGDEVAVWQRVAGGE
jgi:hypothetical protein